MLVEVDSTVAEGSTVEVGFMPAGDTTPTVARVSTAVMRADIMAGTVGTMAGMALIGATRIMATDGDLASGLGLGGPIRWGMAILTDMGPGGEHPTITLTMLPLIRTLTTEAMILARQIPVRNPTTILHATIRELPRGALQAATP